MPADRTRRTTTSRDAAEAAFKAATTKPAELPPKRPTIPNAKELVSLRIDRDILDHFQEAGPGWQDRINEALRKVVGKQIGTAGKKAAGGGNCVEGVAAPTADFANYADADPAPTR